MMVAVENNNIMTWNNKLFPSLVKFMCVCLLATLLVLVVQVDICWLNFVEFRSTEVFHIQSRLLQAVKDRPDLDVSD